MATTSEKYGAVRLHRSKKGAIKELVRPLDYKTTKSHKAISAADTQREVFTLMR